MRTPISVLTLALAVTACGGGGTDVPDDTIETIASSFSLSAGSETFRCTRVNVSAARWIKAFTPSLGNGAFRVWLAVDESPGTEGAAACNYQLDRDWRLLFVAGPGTGVLALPSEIGFAVEPGEQLVLLVHYLNPTGGVLAGTAAVEMLGSGSATSQEAEGFLAGSQVFLIPDGQASVVTGSCTLAASTSIFALMPLMNGLGTDARVWTDAPVHTFIDESYSRLAQGITMIAMYGLDPGDRVRTEFTYVNSSGLQVTYGDDADDELSWVMTYVTPPVVGAPDCVS